MNKYILLVIGLFTMFSCHSLSQNNKKNKVSELTYTKSIGGQGRSRQITFELFFESESFKMDELTEYSLELHGQSIKLKTFKNHLIGHYQEFRDTRDKPYNIKNSLFDLEEITDARLITETNNKKNETEIHKITEKKTIFNP